MPAYSIIDGVPALTVNDWCQSGLTYRQYCYDRRNGDVKILRRGVRGETVIDARSIRRADRLRVIERVMGRVPREEHRPLYTVDMDREAEAFFAAYEKADGTRLSEETVRQLTAKASIFNALREGLARQTERRAASGSKLRKGAYWQTMLRWHTDECRRSAETYGVAVPEYTNVRSLERAFRTYVAEGYAALLPRNMGNDAARKVSRRAENLIVALWRTNDKPFASRVHELYMEFAAGDTELFDRTTGEVFRPEDYRYKGRPQAVSCSTIRRYLKNVVNETAVYADRNGQFDYANSQRPKHVRHNGRFALSKISMDDAVLSRKSTRGWVAKYLCVDVVSGYWFRPAYTVGTPTLDTVMEAFRNVFCELTELGLPMPAELEVEHHLMQNIDWLPEAFQFVRFCSSPTEKRAEHNIRSLKWGTSKKQGHMRGRWYGKAEAFKSVRNKVHGDFIDPTFQPQTIIADDLADIELHNNALHPRQKEFPGLTRREVLLKHANPTLRPIAPERLYKHIGNVTETTIRNNDYVRVASAEFALADFDMLSRLQPNDRRVTAYWLPLEDGSVPCVYLYQGDVYIGQATARAAMAYNECAAERTEEDEARMLVQHKRAARFDRMIRERREEIPQVGRVDRETAEAVAAAPVKIVETRQPIGYEEDELTASMEDWVARAIDQL